MNGPTVVPWMPLEEWQARNARAGRVRQGGNSAQKNPRGADP
ncbi:hypothetical protein SAMN02949497_4395 [Methylomagnum ishizawai]|uniref:Uncharacterized protein n=1 Tax=Methylomagnum ishizawai TaxID=1760988 RepID=A0A1Y6D6X7_9GAMM|nr:hypothetical protein SAMN02949497_3965 [Methylomagnum ishizawai]SMF96981.1 hypothetical protein SAMN02949497_4395 [Methylomagnum ishizawai]